jgi:hypothetical protein
MGEEETYEIMQFIHSEVKAELDTKTNVFLIKENKIELIQNAKADKIELIERMNKNKSETLVWIVGVGVLQFVLAFLTKMLR